MAERDIMKCDRCSKFAIKWTRDIERHVLAGGKIDLKPVGLIKAGCADHPVKSVEVVIQSTQPRGD